MGNKHNKKDSRKLAVQDGIKKLSPDKLWRIALIAFNSLILTVVYFGFVQMGNPIISPVVMIGFWVAFAVMLIVYVVYNRGFTQKGITREMLPDTWTEEKKTEYLEGIAKRQKRSGWMLAVIIPLMVPIALDAVILFTLPIIQSLLGLN